MSCRWRLTPERRSFPPDPSRRFWVFSNTPRPALEMYSRWVQSSITAPSTLSRNACAAGDWAASSRPETTTSPFVPKSIASIRTPCTMTAVARRRGCLRFSKRSAALSMLRGILVVNTVHQPPYQMQPEPTRPSLPDWQLDVHVGCLRNVERLDIIVGQGHFHAACYRVHGDLHLGARGTVFDHVREQLLHRQVDAGQQRRIHSVAGEYLRREGENVLDRFNATPERAAGRHCSASRLTSTTVMSSSCRAPAANCRTDSSRTAEISAADFR